MTALKADEFTARAEAAQIKAKRLYPENVAQLLARSIEAAIGRIEQAGEPCWYEQNAVVYRAVVEIEQAKVEGQ